MPSCTQPMNSSSARSMRRGGERSGERERGDERPEAGDHHHRQHVDRRVEFAQDGELPREADRHAEREQVADELAARPPRCRTSRGCRRTRSPWRSTCARGHVRAARTTRRAPRGTARRSSERRCWRPWYGSATPMKKKNVPASSRPATIPGSPAARIACGSAAAMHHQQDAGDEQRHEQRPPKDDLPRRW